MDRRALTWGGLALLAEENSALIDNALDLMIVLDVSGSMRASDVKPSRIEVATDMVRQFIDRQPAHVKLGIVLVSSAAFSRPSTVPAVRPLQAARCCRVAISFSTAKC